MKKTFISSLLLICLMSWLLPTMIAAKEQDITYDLREKKTNHQFIILGDDNDFEVTMILPDGTKVKSDEFDGEKYMYFSLEDKRIWAVNQAEKGTYTFKVKSDQDNDYRIRAQDSIEKPAFNWQKPSEETINLKEGQEFELKWKAEGSFESSYGDMKIMLQHKDSWYNFEVGSTGVSRESYDLSLPDTIPSGEYELFITLDDVFVEEKEINPDVIIDYKNPEYEIDDIEVVDQIVENGMLYLIIETEKYPHFNRLEAEFYNEKENQYEMSSADWEELDVYKELEEKQQFLWAVKEFKESGDYTGEVLAFVYDDVFTDLIALDPFQVEYVDYHADDIEWSIEAGPTNEVSVDVTVNVSEGTTVTIEDSGEVLAHQEVSEDKATISAPLNEGHRVIEVVLSDGDQNSRTFIRNFQVDHTPPELEMIQPLASHDTLDEPYASGFVELNSTLQVNGKDVDYDEETGYFRVDNIKDQLSIELTDESGNTIDYAWSEHSAEGTHNNWLWIIIINIIIVMVVVGFILYLRRTRNAS